MENSMAAILKNVIKSSALPLTQVSERIETMYLTGRIDAEERLELTELMHEKADPTNELGGWKEMYEALAVKVNGLEGRVKALEALAGGGEEDGDVQTVPEWQMWDGVSGGYVKGDVVAHDGRYWVSGYDGAVNVWEPGALGVDERYWREVSYEEAVQLIGK